MSFAVTSGMRKPRVGRCGHGGSGSSPPIRLSTVIPQRRRDARRLQRSRPARSHSPAFRYVAWRRAWVSWPGKVFRIGHLGSLNDLMLCGTLCGVEMGLEVAGVPHQKGGVAAALEWLSS